MMIPAARSSTIFSYGAVAHIKVVGALEGEFVRTEERSSNEFVIASDTLTEGDARPGRA